MAKLSIVAGATSQSVNIFVQNSSVTTGAGLTGLVFNTSNLIAYYTFTGANATATSITLATLAAVNSAFSSGGFKEVDATNMPGVYRLDIPNAALATSKGQSVVIMLSGAANMAPVLLEIELTGWNNQDAVHGGMSALPNAAAGASSGLLINGSNSGTVTLAALTCTGSFTISDGLLVSRSSSNTSAITATGNGTGSGAVFTSGSGATGDGIQATAASTNGNGIVPAGVGTGHGFKATGGATGHGALLTGGATSGDGIRATATTSGIGLNAIGIGTTQPGIKGTGGTTTSAGLSLVGGATSGDGLLIAATSGHGINTAGTGTTKHGINATGGSTSSDGIRATGGGTGNGINAQSGSGATGDGILSVSNATAGNGITMTHAGSGADLNATTTPLTLAKTTNITGFNDIAATAIVSSGAITTSGGAVSTVTTTTTATNLTNAPTAGDFTATMKTSLNAATPASITGNVGGNVVGSVGSVTTVTARTSSIKKNTALSAFPFEMTDSTTHLPKTGLTVTSTRSLDGAAFGSTTNSATELSNGMYLLDLAAADVNANTVTLRFTATNADDTLVTIITQP